MDPRLQPWACRSPASGLGRATHRRPPGRMSTASRRAIGYAPFRVGAPPPRARGMAAREPLAGVVAPMEAHMAVRAPVAIHAISAHRPPVMRPAGSHGAGYPKSARKRTNRASASGLANPAPAWPPGCIGKHCLREALQAMCLADDARYYCPRHVTSCNRSGDRGPASVGVLTPLGGGRQMASPNGWSPNRWTARVGWGMIVA